jgi:hypothetical protein
MILLITYIDIDVSRRRFIRSLLAICKVIAITD